MIESDRSGRIAACIAGAWPGASFTAEPTPLAGGFWASMYRLRLSGQPPEVPPDVVFRIAPDVAMGAKELAVQQTVAELGYATPRVRLTGPVDDDLGGSWSVMDFAAGVPPLGDLNGIAALRNAPRLFARLPMQLAAPMAALHALDPDRVSAVVRDVAPDVAWSVDELVVHFEAAADVLGRADLVAAVRKLEDCRPAEGDTVICHGDLHPFNLLVKDDGTIVIIDWTASIRAEPAYDVAFTALLLANPPLNAPAPLASIIRRVGVALARRFVSEYRSLAPDHDMTNLAWYCALHGTRILIEAATIDARQGPGSGHPFEALIPAAVTALTAVTGARLAT